MKAAEQKIIDDVKKFGWNIMSVLPEENAPGFAYSIGLYKTFRHPEIIVFGLEPDLMHYMIDTIGKNVKAGQSYTPEHYYSDLIDKFQCWMTEVPKYNYENYVFWAIWFYKNQNFPLLQCVWPTTKGIFPWQKGYPENISGIQPILGIIPKVNK